MLFGVGLSLSQMIDPNKVLNFLDVTGNWDPSLLFVMVGALPIALMSFKLILKRPAPIFADNFQLAAKLPVNTSLILGAVIFGIGWGLSGYCPGPAVTGLGLFSPESVIMIMAIFFGFFIYNQVVILFNKNK
jgi:uncharacterized protein